MCVGNTFCDTQLEQQVTYHELWSNAVGEISHRNFAQLDLVIVPREQLCMVRFIQADRWEALATHHFLVEVVLVLWMHLGRLL